MDRNDPVGAAAEALREAEAVLVTAGAGMGVDSGLPDFRGNHGFWKAYPAIARLGKSFVEMANPEWFHRDPRLAWAFYGHRLNLYRRTVPHEGFRLLLEVARKKPRGYFVFTSNVDGHFQKAGYDESRIEECHGSIHHLQCCEPCSDDIWDGTGLEIDVDEDAFEAHEPLPRCRRCGSMARPNILMFGDWSWVSGRTEDQGRRLSEWVRSVERSRCRAAVVELGAGTAVATVRRLSEQLAHRLGSPLIRINPRDFGSSFSGNIPIPVGAAEGIRAVVSRMGGTA
ncbi:MAG TPA: Sir2 family NAD-dependent protein deacetylase [Syntrophobacteraceae bacterium]|nr:Sir2 family NAD-dependent protein deacetylase [Syntrophobacteraceae bacterium]